MKIEVLGPEQTVKGIKRDGGTWERREQKAAVFVDGEKYPKPFLMPLAQGQSAYPVGVYELTGDFRVGDFERGLEFTRYNLRPAK